MAAALGIDIGGTKGAIIAFDTATWKVTRRHAFPAPSALHDYLAAINDGIDRLRGTEPLVGIGVSCGGPLDLRRGLVMRPPHLPAWDAVPIARLVAAHAGCPAWVQNDANAGAMAERWWGAGQGIDDLIFVTFGTGFGAGIIAGGRLIEGWSGQAGEIGHLRLYDDGPEAFGKAGSVEAFCSGGCIGDRYGRPAQALFVAAAAGEEVALQAVAVIGRDVGRALAMPVDVLNPRRIIIGGIYMRQEALLAPHVRAGLEAEALPMSAADVEIVPAALGEAIGDAEAMAIVRQHLPEAAP